MQFTAATLAALAAVASAKTVMVKVGHGGIKFDPETIEAQKGDTLQFMFTGEHTVVQGDYKKGCEPVSSGGFFSGVFNEDAKTKGKVFEVQVNGTDPMFLYCSYAQHCQNGMVAVVNPTADMTLEKYKSTSSDSEENVSPKAVFGGSIKDASSSGGSGSTSAPATGSQTGTESSMPTGTGSSMPSGTESSMPSGTEASPTESGGSKTSAGAQPTKTNGASSAQVGILAAAAGIAAFIV